MAHIWCGVISIVLMNATSPSRIFHQDLALSIAEFDKTNAWITCYRLSVGLTFGLSGGRSLRENDASRSLNEFFTMCGWWIQLPSFNVPGPLGKRNRKICPFSQLTSFLVHNVSELRPDQLKQPHIIILPPPPRGCTIGTKHGGCFTLFTALLTLMSPLH